MASCLWHMVTLVSPAKTQFRCRLREADLRGPKECIWGTCLPARHLASTTKLSVFVSDASCHYLYYYCSSLLLLVLCGRLSWLSICFWAHINNYIMYRNVTLKFVLVDS